MTGETSPLISKVGESCGPRIGEKRWDPEWNETLAAHPNLTDAAFLLRDAIVLAKSNSTYAHTDYLISSNPNQAVESQSRFSRFFLKILTNPLFEKLMRVCIIALVSLTFIEPPSWCRNFNVGEVQGCEAAMSAAGIPAFYSDDTEEEIQPYYPNSGTTILTAATSLRLEWFLISLLLLHTFLCLGKDRFSLDNFFHITSARMCPDPLQKSKLRNASIFRAIRVIALSMLVIGMLVYPSDRPFAALLRIFLFIAFSEGVQNEIIVVLQIIPALASIGLVLAMIISFYGLIGVAAFYNTSEGTQHFSNFVEAVWTLFTTMTTVIYPDVMMAGYNDNRFVPIYFVSYMCLTFFFFQNVILGTIANGYNTNNDAKKDKIDKAREQLCRNAFEHLTSGEVDHVTREQLMGIFLILNNECDDIDPIPEEEAEVLFSILDKDDSKKLEIDEFLYFGQAMLLEFEDSERYDSLIERRYPELFLSPQFVKFRKVVSSSTFDRAVDIIVLLNAIVVIVQSYPMLSGQSVATDPRLEDGLIDTRWEVLETLFTIFYALEMTSKIISFGWKRYSSSLRNSFDGIITVCAIFASIYVYYPNSYSDSNLIRFVTLVRVLRIFRLFLAIKSFKVITDTFVGILPAASRVIQFLLCVVYIFSWIGMQFFGGLVTRDPSNPTSQLLNGTDFAGAFYWRNNFNDMLSGANVCFNLLVINNWNVLESGIVAVAATKYSRYFFFTFYVVGVMLANNLVVAVVIDYFIDELDSKRSKTDERFEASDIFASRKVGKYVARLKPKYRLTAQSKHDVLEELFSPKEGVQAS